MGVVGVLQFEVLEYRLKQEYNVDIIREPLSYQYVRWIQNEDIDIKSLKISLDAKLLQDFRGNYLILFNSTYTIKSILARNPGLILAEVNTK